MILMVERRENVQERSATSSPSEDLRDQGWPGEVIRFVLLSTHYTKPMDWTEKKANAALSTLKTWRDFIRARSSENGEVSPKVKAALADDMNTPQAITELHRLYRDDDAPGLRASAALLGLLTPELDGWRKPPPVISEDLASQIDAILAERSKARDEKDFALADEIRDRLQAAGIQVADGKQSSGWWPTAEFDASKLGLLS